MRYLPFAVMAAMIAGAPAALAQTPPPNPGDPAAQSEWNRLNAESRRLEQEREQRQLDSQQRLRNEACAAARRNSTALLHLLEPRNSVSLAPERDT